MALSLPFEEKVWYEPMSGCWLWDGHLDKDGYGTHTVNRAPVRAHRLSYTISGKVISNGTVIDHLCRTRSCVNPDHLEAVTPAENTRRSKARVTHCPKGHEYTLDNLRASKSGSRQCKTCHRTREATRRKNALPVRST